MRLASKNNHSRKRMVTNTVICRECIDNLGIYLGHKGRENIGGVKVTEVMEQLSAMDEIDSKQIEVSFINDTTK